MIEYLLLAIMAVATLLLLILRTNTALCFLALCAGYVLLGASGDNAGLIATSLTSGAQAADTIVRLTLLLSPLLVITFLFKKQLSNGVILLSVVPALATAALGVLFVVPVIGGELAANISATELWRRLTVFQEFIVGVGIVVSVIVMAITLRKMDTSHKKGRH
jgi:uncharacterized MnhB-related membrane protein